MSSPYPLCKDNISLIACGPSMPSKPELTVIRPKIILPSPTLETQVHIVRLAAKPTSTILPAIKRFSNGDSKSSTISANLIEINSKAGPEIRPNLPYVKCTTCMRYSTNFEFCNYCQNSIDPNSAKYCYVPITKTSNQQQQQQQNDMSPKPKVGRGGARGGPRTKVCITPTTSPALPVTYPVVCTSVMITPTNDVSVQCTSTSSYSKSKPNILSRPRKPIIRQGNPMLQEETPEPVSSTSKTMSLAPTMSKLVCVPATTSKLVSVSTKFVPVTSTTNTKMVPVAFGPKNAPLVVKKQLPLEIPRPTFYGALAEQSLLSKRICQAVPVIKQPVVKKTPIRKKNEPVCLTISSDEEAEQEEGELLNSTLYSNPEAILNSTNDDDLMDQSGSETASPLKLTESAANTNSIIIQCRSIRIGSFKVHYPDTNLPVHVSKDELRFSVPTVPDETKQVLLTLRKEDLLSILVCFDTKLHVLFFYTTTGIGGIIRARLQMTEPDNCYYDPSSEDETRKRITIIPSTFTDLQKDFLRRFYAGGLLMEINQARANELLVRSTPHGLMLAVLQPRSPVIKMSPVVTRSKSVLVRNENEIKKLLTFPPAPQTGGITITTEDMLCLNEGEFLNDVIIDFYLKYLLLDKLSPEDRDRTYVFSSFFFDRLTRKVTTKKVTGQPTQTCQEARHSRVKTWTRHVDIFEKDFLIVPVNQTSHWFLAVICFPGLVSEASRIQNMNSKVALEETSTDTKDDSGNSTPDANDESTTEKDEDPDTQSALPVPENDVPVVTQQACVIEKLRTNAEPHTYCKIKADSPVPPPSPPLPPPPPPAIPLIAPIPTVDPTIGQPMAPAAVELPKGANLVGYPISDNEVSQSSPESQEVVKEPCIIIFDSLPGTPRWRIVSSLREYLQVEYQTKKGVEVTFDRYAMKGLSARVPRQSNFHDCGIYLLQYVESFFQKPFKSFKSPLPVLEDWFTEDLINKKREDIINLITNLSNNSPSKNIKTATAP